jgi:uncharacterized surface protein with fasciclin (FAS1) repeats
MKRSSLNRASGLAALALTMSLGLTACGGDANSEPSATETKASAPAKESAESEPMADDAGADTFGPGCSAIPTTGDGSFNGMATAPVATAASANPLLKTLVAAVTKAKLVDTLNSAEDITVFAPTDDAFAKIPKKTLNAVLKDKATLTKILTHHVVAGQLGPDDLAGEHETLAGDMLTVEGSGEDFTVAGDNAAVLCGNIPTANATVYVVDTVLMPTS